MMFVLTMARGRKKRAKRSDRYLCSKWKALLDKIRFELPQVDILTSAVFGSLVLTPSPWSWTLWKVAIIEISDSEPLIPDLNHDPDLLILDLELCDPAPLIQASEVYECLAAVIVFPMGGGWEWGAEIREVKGPAIGPALQGTHILCFARFVWNVMHCQVLSYVLYHVLWFCLKCFARYSLEDDHPLVWPVRVITTFILSFRF